MKAKQKQREGDQETLEWKGFIDNIVTKTKFINYKNYVSHVLHGGTIKNEEHQLIFDIHILPKIELFCLQRNIRLDEEKINREIQLWEFRDFILERLYPSIIKEPNIKAFLDFHYTEYLNNGGKPENFEYFIRTIVDYFNSPQQQEKMKWTNVKVCNDMIIDWLHNIPLKRGIQYKKPENDNKIPTTARQICLYHSLLSNAKIEPELDIHRFTELGEKYGYNPQSLRNAHNRLSHMEPYEYRIDLQKIVEILKNNPLHEKAYKKASNQLQDIENKRNIRM